MELESSGSGSKQIFGAKKLQLQLQKKYRLDHLCPTDHITDGETIYDYFSLVQWTMWRRYQSGKRDILLIDETDILLHMGLYQIINILIYPSVGRGILHF